jgi:hypothetical protein
MKKSALVLPLVVGLAVSLYGQGGPPPPPPGGPGHHGHFGGPGFGPEMGMHPWKIVTGAPYSATVTEQFTQTLANGTTISRTTTAQMARDSSGRTYVQQTMTGGPFSNSQSGPKTIVFITDPVAGYSYMLNAAKNTAIRRPFHTPPPNSSSPPQHQPRQGNANVTVTDLGTQTDSSSGLELQGKQITRNIPAGTIGNSQAISSVSETWYSPALQIVVRSTRNDPRFGQTTYTLSNISQNEPNASLFTVPSGYTVQDAPHWRGGENGPAQ